MASPTSPRRAADRAGDRIRRIEHGGNVEVEVARAPAIEQHRDVEQADETPYGFVEPHLQQADHQQRQHQRQRDAVRPRQKPPSGNCALSQRNQPANQSYRRRPAAMSGARWPMASATMTAAGWQPCREFTSLALRPSCSASHARMTWRADEIGDDDAQLASALSNCHEAGATDAEPAPVRAHRRRPRRLPRRR